jgi:hypothetical protein
VIIKRGHDIFPTTMVATALLLLGLAHERLGGARGGHGHGSLTHEETVALHRRNVNPPLPSSLGRPITGCFLEDERQCNGLANVPRPPLALVPRAFKRVPYGSVIPKGWLARQLRIQADGMAGW